MTGSVRLIGTFCGWNGIRKADGLKMFNQYANYLYTRQGLSDS